MTSDSPVFIYGIGSIGSDSTIPELISFARSAFLPSDFEMVEKILLAREKESYLMAEKHCESERLRLLAEEKLEKNKKELESLMKGLKNKDDMILRLNSEIEECTKRYEALDQRVLHLEEEIETLEKQLPSSQMKLSVGHETEEKETFGDEKSGGSSSSSRNGLQEADLKSFDVARGNGSTIRTQPVSESKSSDRNSSDVACDNGSPIKKEPVSKSEFSGKILGSSPAINNKPQLKDIIEIEDSDDENPEVYKAKHAINSSIHKRKRSSHSDDDDDDDVSIPADKLQGLTGDEVVHAGPTIRRCNETPEGRSNWPAFTSGSDSGDEDLTDSFIESLVADIRRQKGNIRVWLLEVDMRKALENEEELCMNAVCALSRKIGKSDNNQGFNAFDAGRATALAGLLTDRNPQGKIKKSSSELDPNIVDECRKLALLYSKQLFQIYKKKEDPFFPCPKRDG